LSNHERGFTVNHCGALFVVHKNLVGNNNSNKNKISNLNMNPISAKTGLEEPLLAGDEQEDLVELVDDDEEEEEHQQQQESTRIEFGTSCWDYVCILLLVPGLLWLQFAVAFRTGKAADLTVCSVALTILLFTAASYMYKRCLSDHDFSNRTVAQRQVLLLLPEILMDVILGLVLLGPTSMAFEALLYCTMALAFFVIISTVITLQGECSSYSVDEQEDEEEVL
jgi:hypothetical protein